MNAPKWIIGLFVGILALSLGACAEFRAKYKTASALNAVDAQVVIAIGQDSELSLISPRSGDIIECHIDQGQDDTVTLELERGKGDMTEVEIAEKASTRGCREVELNAKREKIVFQKKVLITGFTGSCCVDVSSGGKTRRFCTSDDPKRYPIEFITSLGGECKGD